jgi:hypothetical protein
MSELIGQLKTQSLLSWMCRVHLLKIQDVSCAEAKDILMYVSSLAFLLRA